MKYRLIQDKNQIARACELYENTKFLGFDIETDNKLEPHEGFIRLVQLSDGEKTILIDFKEAFPGYWQGLDIKDDPALLPLKRLLEREDIQKILHNAKFDYKWILYHLGIKIKKIFDSLIASQLIAYDDRHNLAAVAKKYTGIDLDKTEQNTDWTSDLTPAKCEYAAFDVHYMPLLREKMRQRLIDEDLVKVAALEFDIIHIYAEMELDGVHVNREMYEKKIAEMEKLHKIVSNRLQDFMASFGDVRGVQPALFEEIPDQDVSSFLLSSSEQVGKKLISMGVPIINKFHPEVIQRYAKIRTVSGHKGSKDDKAIAKAEMKAAIEYVQKKYEDADRPFAKGTGEPALQPLIEDFEALRPLDQFRKVEKMTTSYGHGLLAKLKNYVGNERLYPDWKQIGAPTGRNSTKNPSVQNIPDKPIIVGTEEHELKVREAFDYPEGTVGISADMPNIELRIMADLSNDEAMIQAFLDGKDLHSDTASRLFGIEYEYLLEGHEQYKKYKGKRKEAKIVNFAIPYGANEYNLYKKMGNTIEEAREIKDAYFRLYHGLHNWLTANADTAIRTLQVRSHWGRRQIFKPYENNKQKGAIRRSGFNTPIQASAADMMKYALLLLKPELDRLGAKLVTVVHDEVNIECPAENAEECCAKVSEKVTEGCNAILTRVPVQVKANIVRSWADK